MKPASLYKNYIMAKFRDSEEALAKALFLVINNNVSVREAARSQKVSERSLYRYKQRKTADKPTEVIVKAETTALSSSVATEVDGLMEKKLRFQKDLMEVKEITLAQLRKKIKRVSNVDYLQKVLKTLNDIDKVVDPKGDTPPVPQNVNIVQFFNQKVINEGDESKDIPIADIVEND